MVIQQQLHSIDTVWELAIAPENDSKRYYLINGELFEMSPVNRQHANIASLLIYYLQGYVLENDLGEVHTEAGYHPTEDRYTLLAPDVSFISHARVSQQPQDKFIALMPDLAVEVVSPSNSIRQIRRKAAIYLNNGASLVWIVLPEEKGVDVCRSVAGSRLDIEFVGQAGKLSGEGVLPGFELEMTRLFPLEARS